MNKKDILEDLLPLYREDLLKEGSKDFVRENIKDYPDLCEDLEEMGKGEKKEDENRPLGFLKEAIERDKKAFALSISMLVLSLCLLIFCFLTRPLHFDYEEDLVGVKTYEGRLVFEFDPKVTGLEVDRAIVDKTEGSEEITYLDAYATRLGRLQKSLSKSKEKYYYSEIKKPETKVYYVNHGRTAKLLVGQEDQGGVAILPRLFLNYYGGLALIFLVFVLVFGAIFKKKRGELKRKYYLVLALPVSYLLSQLLIVGFSGTSYYGTYDFCLIILLAFSVYLFFTGLIRLIFEGKNKN